jgi:hypothetical protein
MWRKNTTDLTKLTACCTAFAYKITDPGFEALKYILLHSLIVEI